MPLDKAFCRQVGVLLRVGPAVISGASTQGYRLLLWHLCQRGVDADVFTNTDIKMIAVGLVAPQDFESRRPFTESAEPGKGFVRLLTA